ncbi:MAG TPA: hypothetical protein VNE61_13015 [Ktedonobacteraceae bacterium]|nr:hypothetical protein [Ktedonobacteraceae bacterium]
MATTGELRAIMQELQLVDAGDAASYLGEETVIAEVVTADVSASIEEMYLLMTAGFLCTDDCDTCQPVSV